MKWSNLTDKWLNSRLMPYFILGCLLGLYPLIDEKVIQAAILLVIGSVSVFLINTKYHAAVIMDIFLLCAVIIEPAPSDIMFIFLIIFGVLNKKLKYSRVKSLLFVFLCILGYVFINLTDMYAMMDNRTGIKYFGISLYLIIFCIYIALYTTSENMPSMQRAYVASATFSSVIGFMGYLGVFSQIVLYDAFRMKGLFKDPNVLAPFIIPAIIITIDDMRAKAVIRANNLWHFIIIFINMLAVIFTFSRAAWLNLAFSMFIYFIFNSKRVNLKKLLAYTFIIVLCIGVVWGTLMDPVYKDFFLGRTKLQSYDMQRFEAQRTGFYLTMVNPLGWGPGQYEMAVSEIMNEEFSAHNLYIRLLLENGIIGFILFLSVLIYIFIKLIVMDKNVRKGGMSTMLLSILLGIMVNSAFIDTLHWRHFWFFIGMSLAVIGEGVVEVDY